MWGEIRPVYFGVLRWECGEVKKVGKVGRWERWEVSEVKKVEKVTGWWGGKVRSFWFYSMVGDAEWVQDFIFLFLMSIKEWRGRMGLRSFA